MTMEEPTGEMTNADRDRMLWQIHTALLGADGQRGLIEQVMTNTKGLIRLKMIVAGTIGLGGVTGIGFAIPKIIDALTH